MTMSGFFHFARTLNFMPAGDLRLPMFNSNPSNLLSSSLVNGQSGQLHHHHLYLTPVKSPSPSNAQISATSSFYSRFASNSISHQLVSSNLTARTNGVIGSGLSNGPQIQQSFGQSCQTRTASGINNSAGNADVELKDRCEHQGSIYRRSLCDHCGEKFCDSCEISHKEKLKKEILSMSQTFLQQDYNFDRETLEARALNVREHLGRYAESVRRNVESEIACTEMKFLNASRAFMAKLRQEGDAIIAQALELRDAEVNDLISIGTEAVRCQEDKARISQLTDRLQSQQVLFITLHDMSLLHRELVRYYGMRTAIEALRNSNSFYSDKALEFNRHPGFVLALERCLEFFQTAQLGSVKFSSPVSKIRDMLAGKQNFDSSPFKPIFNQSVSGSSAVSVDGSRSSLEFVGKSFYERIEVIGYVAGKDADQWDIRKPFGLVWLTNTDYLAVVHRPKRITLITINGEIKATFQFADPDSHQSGGLNFHGNMAADDEWKIYFIDEPGLRIFSFDVKANRSKEGAPALSTPHVFTRLHSSGGGRSAISLSQLSDSASNDAAFCNKMKFHGLAIGLARRELYTEAGDSIVGFSLADGTPRFRCLLEPSHQFSSHVLGVIDRPNAISYLIYSTSHGNILHKKAFLSNGLLEVGSSVIAYQGSEMNCVSEVRGVANDPAGNLLLADSKNNCIKVFSENFQVLSSFGMNDHTIFNPSAVAVACVPNKQPIVVVTEFNSHRVIFFSAR